ncbi:alpha/beta hydrolase [Methylogaea oryzae]|uniref:Alpha/beta hydrolase n=2 Tax=Methylogaea oryzae TaxID=1295382 RepID=A0A8D4VQI6_9GAMM|nr:alpha/beta hydrolase [Methylogaea oryzae]BBL70585.1 hypothetical protein MoryE10_11910 [Methylogaea oryzae]
MSLAAACSLWRGYEPVNRDAEMERFTSHGGYAPQNYAVSSTRETWSHDGALLDVSISIPSAPGKRPVVFYLPGMGEGAANGELWRRQWAQAGYVVVSMQPKEYGEASLANKQGGAGDPGSPGRTAFSEAVLKNNVSQFLWGLGKIADRLRSGNERYAPLDLSRVALAGYDLGAQTVLRLAAAPKGLPVPSPVSAFRAVIVMGAPVATFSGKVAGDIRMPLLLVGNGRPDNPAGASAPEKSAWLGLPAGQKYWLSLERASHRLLSGSMSNGSYWSEVIDVDSSERGGRAARGRPGYDGVTGATSSAGGDWLRATDTAYGSGQTPVEYDALGGASSRGGGRSRNSAPSGGNRGSQRNTGDRSRQDIESQARAARQMAIVASVTTAFLDATVQASTEAHDWLAEEASSWLEDYAQWLQR